MKKILFCIAFMYCRIHCQAQEMPLKELVGISIRADASKALMKVTKDYFRSQPLSQRFSSFITSLQKDPWFTIETYERRTDSTFFYLNGTYKNFNPFHYDVKEIRLIIAEEEFIHIDSLHTKDTIINLQLMGITDTTAKIAGQVQKEFKRFDKNYRKDFGRAVYDYSSQGGITTAEMYNYFFPSLAICHVTSAWGQLPGTYQYTFTLTIRFKLIENEANLVLFPGE
ncbi:MAG: hypothetical protein EPN92_14430 [Chitinophagaceae bacterium]|nr:MAG: hypothetical protein EPN92_14430 [Chitinophagaceae bacterium]